MWDYNNDGVIDYQDESDYWDDVYYEEHRDDYSAGYFNNNAYSSPKNNKNSMEDVGIGWAILIGIGYVFLLVICGMIALLGLGVCVVFPPLGIVIMIPFYKLIGGK